MAKAPKPVAAPPDPAPVAAGATSDAPNPAADAGVGQAGAVAAVPVTNPPASGFRLRVRALQPSRWRAGRQFGPDPVGIAAEDLTEAQMIALRDDPLLAVDVIAPD